MGILRSIAAHLASRIKAIPSEIATAITDKIIPQGAAEISQALFAGGSPYVPYGSTQHPLSLSETKAPQPAQAPAAVQAPQAGTAHDYEKMLASHAARLQAQEQHQQKGMER